MNNLNFIFKINSHEQISIELDEYLNDVPYCFYKASFFFHYKNKKIKLCYFSLISYIEKFIFYLGDVLKNHKQLPICLLDNIGYAWNLYVNATNHADLVYANEKYQNLDNFELWYSTFTTWIYNDNSGNIILEITPSYPHIYSSDFSYEHFLEWMKNYKSLYKTIISRKTAEQWFAQATQILIAIDENTEKLHSQGKL